MVLNPNKRAPDYRDRDYAKGVTRSAPKSQGTIVPRIEEPRVKVAIFETLEDCERALVSGFRQVAEAMARIREGRLYEKLGYDNFRDYCEERLGFGGRRGDYLASAYFTLKSLPGHCRELLTSESATRAIAEVPEEKRVGVLKQVSKAGPVTAKAIKEAIQPAQRKVEPAVIDVEPQAVVKHCPTCVCGNVNRTRGV